MDELLSPQKRNNLILSRHVDPLHCDLARSSQLLTAEALTTQSARDGRP
jgi:hypothetical protein